jgi:hypothetical protein
MAALKPIGWWVSPQSVSELPAPQELMEDLLPADRDALGRYLAEGLRLVQYRGYSWCRFSCGIADSNMGSWDLTDGIWVWPEGLAHYIDTHSVGLPQEFTKHALAGPAATMPEKSEPYDDKYWTAWCAARRVPKIRNGMHDVLAKSDAELLAPKAQRIEALELERGTSNEKCLWSHCTRSALVGTKICAEHHLEQTGPALLALNRYKALRAYLKQLPTSLYRV